MGCFAPLYTFPLYLGDRVGFGEKQCISECFFHVIAQTIFS